MAPLTVGALTVLLCQMMFLALGLEPSLEAALAQFVVGVIVGAIILRPRGVPRG